MRVGMILHCDQTTGRLDDALASVDAWVERYQLNRDEAVPADADFDRVIVLGGAMGAYEEDRHPWLAEEKRWLRRLVEARVPVLGICLGSQLLADALGGKAYRAERAEAAVVPLQLTTAGRADPVLPTAEGLVVSLHHDTFELPAEAVLLAESDRFPQAFRMGSALGLQFHPDADLALLEVWAREETELLTGARVERDQFLSAAAAADTALDDNSRRLFAAWLAET
jgi:GMP synthase (glutamine-hydrolysing)